jgi:hypothetical protein
MQPRPYDLDPSVKRAFEPRGDSLRATRRIPRCSGGSSVRGCASRRPAAGDLAPLAISFTASTSRPFPDRPRGRLGHRRPVLAVYFVFGNLLEARSWRPTGASASS